MLEGFTRSFGLNNFSKERYSIKTQFDSSMYSEYNQVFLGEIENKIDEEVKRVIINKFIKEFDNSKNEYFIDLTNNENNFDILYTLPYKKYFLNTTTYRIIELELLKKSIINFESITGKKIILCDDLKFPDNCIYAFDQVLWDVKNLHTHKDYNSLTRSFSISIRIDNPMKIWIIKEGTSMETSKRYRIYKREKLINDILDSKY